MRRLRNFTDPDSLIMPDGANKGSFVQGYNAQAAVDATAQVTRGCGGHPGNHEQLPTVADVSPC